MAVYTHLSQEEIADIARQFGLGELTLALGIAEGVENSNYLVETRAPDGRARRAILTIYEKRVHADDLPFFLQLMQHLSDRGVACPVPLTHSGGQWLLPVRNKLAAMVSFLQGQSRSAIRNEHVAALGHAMAQMHLAAEGMVLSRPNRLSYDGWQQLYRQLGPRLDEIESGLAGLVESELAYLREHWPTTLPRGIIHADLFPNNVFFQGEQLSGIIDFYFACEDMLAYEIGICLNCWCFETSGEFNTTKAARMMVAYDAARPLSAEEKQVMPVLARGAALRFLLTRAHDWLFRAEGALVTPLDPREYSRKLRFHQKVQHIAEYGL